MPQTPPWRIPAPEPNSRPVALSFPHEPSQLSFPSRSSPPHPSFLLFFPRKLSPQLRPWAGTVGTPTASPSTRINSRPTPPSSPRIQQFGWKYAVIDEGWYMTNPAGKNVEEQKLSLGRQRPADPRSRALSLRGQRRRLQAARRLAPHAGPEIRHSHRARHSAPGGRRKSAHRRLSFHAVDAADTTAPCPWDEGNWGIKDNAAGQAYYDSMIRLYASWGLDFIKVDCISDHPYRPTEIRQIAAAIRKTGRPIVLCSRPAPPSSSTPPKSQKYAQMWRITNDHWDAWEFCAPHSGRLSLRPARATSTCSPSGTRTPIPATGLTRTCSPRDGSDLIPAGP